MSDELPTAARVSDPGIRALYRIENRWQAWLDVEAALAKAQAELGIIPKEAAEAIVRAAHYDLMDRARLDEGFARTGHTIVPLVWELSRVTGEPHGGWVHWGATTQNITQTGDLLVLRQAHGIILGLIADASTLRRRSPSAAPRCRWRGARTVSTPCRRPLVTRSRCGSTNCVATSSG
jgi:3-carboxy-cis,cis-muconate cycloisomerase